MCFSLIVGVFGLGSGGLIGLGSPPLPRNGGHDHHGY